MQNDRPKAVYGGFFVRLAAYVIDWVVSGVISLLALIPISMICGVLPESIGTEPILFQYTLSGILTYCVKVGYFILLTYTTGKTLGKRAMNLRVINADGTLKLNLVNVIFRETIGRFLAAIMNLGYLMIGIDSDKRGLHDRLCDTLVIYEKEIVVHQIRKEVAARPVAEYEKNLSSENAVGTGFSLVKEEVSASVAEDAPALEMAEYDNIEGLENKREDQ